MRWRWVGLVFLLAFDVWWRLHTVGPTIRARWGVDLWPATRGEAEPLDCDESAYAYIGRHLVRGDVLYRDFTENKPPGGYWLYALAVAIGGANELTVRLMPIPFILATLALVLWLGLRLRGPGAAFLAGLTFAVASTDPYLFGNGANMEHAMNLFSTSALALMVANWDRPGRVGLVAAGACLGAACLVKQVAFTHGLVFAAALLWRRRSLQTRLVDLAALAGGFALVWGLSALVLVARGAGPAAYEDIFRYGSALATDTPPEPHAPPFLVRWITGNADPSGELPPPFGRTTYLVWWARGSWPLWLSALPTLLWLGLAPGTTPARRLVAAWTLSAWVQVALPRLFWPHYYLLPVPGLAIAVAVFLADAATRVRGGIGLGCGGLRGGLAFIPIVGLGGTVFLQVRDYLLVPPEELTIRYKGGRQWVALRDLGRDLARRSKIWPEPRLFVWGWQSPLFIYSGLDGVTRHFFADPLLKAFATGDHPLIRPRIEEIVRDLHARPPALIFAGDPPFPALRRFLAERYLPAQVMPGGRGLWVERSRYGEFMALGKNREK
jgi:4-amino-4-deoxy-L-arabinose transferase-like glycosyltransferase